MRILISKAVLLFLAFSFTSLAENKLVGYLPSYRNLDLKKTSLLTDLILFSLEPQKDGSFTIDERMEKLLTKIQDIKNCRKFICVGGWGKSTSFKTICSDPEIRKKLIENIYNFIKRYKLDGVDYDWEHPKNKEEAQSYEKLIKETADKGIKVSLAASSWQKFTPEVFKHLFAVNIMSYDHPKEHSTVEMAQKDIEKFIKMGCPPEKLNLGVPFYGRHIENRKALSFNRMFLKDRSIDLFEGYYLNNTVTLKKKAELVKSLKLSGIMIWEIEQDDYELTLLKALHSSLKE